MIIILILVSGLFLSLGVFSSYRIQLVYKLRIKWNYTIYKYWIYLLDNKHDQYLLLNNNYSYDDLFNIIGSYNSMFFKFWCKNIEDFISDKDKVLYKQITKLKGE